MNTMNSKLASLLGAVLLLSACSVPTQVSDVQDAAQTAQDVAQKAQGFLKHKDSLLSMKDGASQTLAAVRSGDFSMAQQQFSAVQSTWKTIETDLTNNAGESVQAIQTNLDAISTDLQAESPDKDKLVTNLQSLSTSLVSVATGGALDAATNETEEDKAQVLQNNLSAMKAALQQTTTAVQSGDYAAAKESFGTARQTWYQFGGSVKEKSADIYQTLDEEVKTVNTALSQETPQQNTLLTSLNSLISDLDTVSAN